MSNPFPEVSMKIFRLMLALFFLTAASQALAAPSPFISGDPQEVPIKGMVTMVDIGAKACIPCKMMIPIISRSLCIDISAHADIKSN
jgi:thiol-disulfide isomerase/thioredoxin